MKIPTLRKRSTRTASIVSLVLIAALVPLGFLADSASGATRLNLGAAAPFAILAETAITDVGSSVASGDVGVSPGTSDGLTCSQVNGTIYYAPPTVVATGPNPTCTTVNSTVVPADALSAANAQYTSAGGEAATMQATELGGTTVGPGVYDSGSTQFDIAVGDTLTLDGGGDPNAVFIFQAPKSIFDALNVLGNVALTGDAQACNIFWVVYGANIGAGVTFDGTILSGTGITIAHDSTVNGSLFAQSDVTLDDDTINGSTCASSTSTSTSSAGTSTTCTLVSSVNPAVVGEPVTFTAVITGSNPAGIVTFADGSTSLGTVALVGGQATLTTASLSAGDNTIWASYPGDAGNAACSFGYFDQVVNLAAATPTTTLPPVATPTPTTIPIPVPKPIKPPKLAAAATPTPTTTLPPVIKTVVSSPKPKKSFAKPPVTTVAFTG